MTQPFPSPRTALVTGASRGIGAAVACQLANAGFSLALAARSTDATEEVASRCRELGAPCVEVITVDLGGSNSRRNLLEEVCVTLGHLDTLVHAAGMAVATPIHKATDEMLRQTFELNVFAAHDLTRSAVQLWRGRQPGRIIHIASIAGLRGYPYVSAYAASKHALVGLVRSVAKEVAEYGITINAVCPGYVDTEITRATIDGIVQKTGRSEAEARHELMAHNPQGRLFTPEEVAHSVAFLASEMAGGINGQCITICGGESA